MSARKSATIKRIKCCAFCGMTQFQVPILIQGPAIGFESPIHICGACVKVCSDMVVEFEEPQVGTEVAASSEKSGAFRSEAL